MEIFCKKWRNPLFVLFMFVSMLSSCSVTSNNIDELINTADQGDAFAQFYLGGMYYHGQGVPQDYKEAVKWYKKAGENGDPVAQYNLGEMYLNGKGVAQDYEEAVKWVRKAAVQEDSISQFFLGQMYYYGKGVEQDYKEAGIWFKKAAEQGEIYAQTNLGNMYYSGDGVSKDHKEAVKWYRKAAEHGDALGQRYMGDVYYVGHGVSKNYKEAFRWYKKSAEQGLAPAQYNLGNMYYNGRGVTRNRREATKWLGRASEQGHSHAKLLLDCMTNENNCEPNGVVYDPPSVKIENGYITEIHNCTELKNDSDILTCAQYLCQKRVQKELAEPLEYFFAENSTWFLDQTKTVILSKKIYYIKYKENPYYGIYRCTVTGNQIINFSIQKSYFAE